MIGRIIDWHRRAAFDPPFLLRICYPLIFFWMALAVGLRRGWLVGIVAAVVYGGMGLVLGLAPHGLTEWSRRYPGLDGAFLGPLLFLALAYLTPLSVWWCLGLGLLGVLVGFTMGTRRGRRLRADAGLPD